ncbi:hypothetical protein O9929_01935 [Vibrio lentus]|nr:hypothetical protein [Vibrio lentus]
MFCSVRCSSTPKDWFTGGEEIDVLRSLDLLRCTKVSTAQPLNGVKLRKCLLVLRLSFCTSVFRSSRRNEVLAALLNPDGNFSFSSEAVVAGFDHQLNQQQKLPYMFICTVSLC